MQVTSVTKRSSRPVWPNYFSHVAYSITTHNYCDIDVAIYKQDPQLLCNSAVGFPVQCACGVVSDFGIR